MNKEEFSVAQVIEQEGWEFVYEVDNAMVFTRIIGGVTWTARIKEDR